jgi:methyl-accepting chemotaxis protein
MDDTLLELREQLLQKKNEVALFAAMLEENTRTTSILNKVLDNSTLVAMTDVKGDITFVNDEFVRVSKYSREELIGQNHRIIKSDFHSDLFFESLWKTISSGDIWRSLIRNRAKDGSIYWVRSTLMPTHAKDDTIDGYTAVRTPVSDLMQPFEEAYLQEKNDEEIDGKMKAVLQLLKDGTYEKYDWL